MASKRYTIVSILASLILAAALWVYVSLMRTYEGDVQVPVVAIPPPGQTILSNVPKFINVHVRTSGLNIVNMRYFNKPQTCTLTVSKLRSVGPERYVLSNAELLSELSDVIASRMLSTMPSELAITTGTPEIKKVPITIPHVVSLRPGFVLASPPTPDAATVTIRGMASVVQKIDHWSTQKLFIEDAHESMVLDVPMLDSLTSSLDVSPKFVRVRLDIQRLADLEIADVPVTMLNGTGQADVSIRPSHVRVTLRGGVDNIASITRDDIVVELDGASKTGFATPRARTLKNARVVSISPRMVQIVRIARR